MSTTFVPTRYQTALSLYRTQEAISFIKEEFQTKLASALNLFRASSPLFVDGESGLNDNLSGVERPVRFEVKETGTDAEVVHSLAKWKRFALAKYGVEPFRGLYTDMNAIRRDEDMDNIHSIYVDQWDWEKVITKDTRNEQYLKKTVSDIVGAICDTAERVKEVYGIDCHLSRDVAFVTTQELEDMYPNFTPKEREDAVTKQYRSVFIMGIGGALKSGERHDSRAPDYDDWTLNGDIMLYNDVLGRAFEISSMGIRVDAESLIKQLTTANCLDRLKFPFHKALASDTLPLTMGGGIGQSRLCMIMLNKAHIGEVQCSVWDTQTLEICERHGIQLL